MLPNGKDPATASAVVGAQDAASAGARNSPANGPTATHRMAKVLAQSIVVAQWPKNDRGELIVLTLKGLNRANLVQLSTHFLDGTAGGRGYFSATVNHLPALARAFAEAAQRARQLGLIDEAK
jgi:hypothetical protein